MSVPQTIQRLFDQLLHVERDESGTTFSGPLANLMAAKIACEEILELGDVKAKRAANELLKVFAGMLDSYAAGKETVENLYTTAAERAAGKKKAVPKPASKSKKKAT